MRIPLEDSGESLVNMAQRDLDAALQLLAERAQYITGASGATIALRRQGYNDMLCRASSGPNAPELGALLSAEFGLSGESVRTRSPLRCDDVERDGRVNVEGCRRLGIASVAVNPIVSDDSVLGVFELFSGKTNAFEQRDLSALQRLGEMVETAVLLARSAQVLPAQVTGEFVRDVGPGIEVEAEVSASAAQNASALEIPASLPEAPSAETTIPMARSKPLLWSAAIKAVTKPLESDQSHLPPVLRNLRKCERCGFPVSATRTLCVECEEKNWQPHVSKAALHPADRSAVRLDVDEVRPAVQILDVSRPGTGPASLGLTSVESPSVEQVLLPALAAEAKTSRAGMPAPHLDSSGGRFPLFGTGLTSSQSWLSGHKYVLGMVALVVVALAVIAIFR